MYDELVKALRNHRVCDEDKCATCELMDEAADAIEELQQIADHYEQTAKGYWKEACEYKQRIAELEDDIIYWQTYAAEIER